MSKLLLVPEEWNAHPADWNCTPEQLWDNFIKRLNEVRPIYGQKKEQLPHVAFLGGIEYYKKIFLDANKP